LRRLHYQRSVSHQTYMGIFAEKQPINDINLMTNSQNREENLKRGAFTRFLDSVEWLGNLLPHPVTLFAILCVH